MPRLLSFTECVSNRETRGRGEFFLRSLGANVTE